MKDLRGGVLDSKSWMETSKQAVGDLALGLCRWWRVERDLSR